MVCLQRFEVNAHRRERFLNGFLLVRRFPLADKIGQGSVFTLDIGSGVVDNILLLKQLAIRIIDRNGLIDNLYLAAVPVHDGRFHRIIGRILPTTAVTAALWLGAAMLKTLVLLNRTVPFRVGEQPCHIPKVHHDKVCLALLFSDTGSSSDHLFERGHALHSLIKNNELGHLAVCAGGKQFRCGCNHGIWFGYRDEIVKFGLAIHI